MVYGISRYCGSVVAIKKWPNKTAAKTIAKWAEHKSGSGYVDLSTKRAIHYPPRGWKGPDLHDLTLGAAALYIEKASTSPDKEAQ